MDITVINNNICYYILGGDIFTELILNDQLLNCTPIET